MDNPSSGLLEGVNVKDEYLTISRSAFALIGWITLLKMPNKFTVLAKVRCDIKVVVILHVQLFWK